MGNRYSYKSSFEISMRQEFENTMDGRFPESPKARPVLIRKARKDSNGRVIPCPCVDKNTNEADVDTFCPYCVTGDTLVRTSNGLKEMVDIQVGDLVMGKDAQLHQVTEKQQTTTDKLITIYSTLRCDPLKVTPDHGMFAIKREDYKKRLYIISELLAKDLKEGDLLLMPKPTTNKSLDNLTIDWMTYCKNITSAEKLPKTLILTDDLLWTIGLWLAEGHIGGDREIVFSLNINELDLAQKVEKAIKELSPGLVVTHIEKPEVHTRQVCICNTALANWLGEECGKGCDKKHMPSFYWKLSPEQQMQIVMGLWEGDGSQIHIDNDRDTNRCSIGITARAVAHDAQLTLWQAGFFAGISTYQRTNRKRVYTVEWIDIPNRGTRGFFSFEDFWASKITRLVTSDLDNHINVYDISVADGHAFIANNTLSHNCHGEGYYWDEIWADVYKVHEENQGAFTEKLIPAGLMQVHQAVFYLKYNAGITIEKEDRIVEVELDYAGIPSLPHRRKELYRVGIAIDLRADNGKLEYWKLYCYTEKRKYLNGDETK